MLSEAYVMTGELDRARDVASRALTATEGFPLAAGYVERAIGRLALAAEASLRRAIETFAFLRRALETFVSIDARCQMARSHLALADLAVARADPATARAELERAHELVKRMQAPRLVERTPGGGGRAYVEGGLDGPPRDSPQNRIARAKPALGRRRGWILGLAEFPTAALLTQGGRVRQNRP